MIAGMAKPAQITLAGQVYNVRITAKGQYYIGDETIEAFVERQSLLGRDYVLEDLAAIGLVLRGGRQTAFSLHRNRERAR